MDFAENYVCSHADEVQSAYFDKGTVTLHPTVIYYKATDGTENKLEHKSHVLVSDTHMHNPGTVLAFIKEVVPVARQLVPSLKTIHYVTDSPTSQYRNRYMFYVVANHHTMFDGIRASWQYFEAGHGKWPCDGVGGTAKRQADSAVKRQVCSIQNADDFYTWASLQDHSSLNYTFVANKKCSDASEELNGLSIQPVKGTMSVHSVVSLGDKCIAVRDTSCFCDECFSSGIFYARCMGWNRHTIKTAEDTNRLRNQDQAREVATTTTTPASTSTRTDTDTRTDTNTDTRTDTSTVDVDHRELNHGENTVGHQYAENTYVAALYDEKWYVGKISEFDPDDVTYNVSFMTGGTNRRVVTFKWPEKEDTLWLAETSILCAIRDPVLYGKTRQFYKLHDQDLQKILELYS